jgi:hypothetical protein
MSSYLRKCLALFMIVILLEMTVSCRYYYTYRLDSNATVDKVDKLSKTPSYMIVHQSDLAFHLRGIKVDNAAQTISGTLEELPFDHLKYLDTKSWPGSSNRYRKKANNPMLNSPHVINEVHVYTKDLTLEENQYITIPMASIEKMEVYDPDTGATTASFVFGGLAITAAAAVLFVIIILLTKSSCPFVYVDNGEEYVFTGEIFSGAIFKNLQRDDYMMLPLHDSLQSISVTIANKLKEKQYIDQASVMRIEHPDHDKVLVDRLGKVHAVDKPVQLSSAMVDGVDISVQLKAQDNKQFSFDSDGGDDYFNSVELTFPKPLKSVEGHLIFHTKNTLWSDYLFGEFTQLFGENYPKWVEKQNNNPDVGKEHWAEKQGMNMSVFVETASGWKFVDKVELVGPLAYRDVVVPINLSAHVGDVLHVKVTSGFMMWDVDFIGMDYTEDTNIKSEQLILTTATANDVAMDAAVIIKTDKQYHEQLAVGDNLSLTFKNAGIHKNDRVSFVLQTSGYYNHVREYSGEPQIVELLSFKTEGRMSRFSKEKLDELNKILETTTIAFQKPIVQD